MQTQHSPSRARIDRLEGRRDYFRRPSSASWWKGRLALAALILASGWLLWGYASTTEERQYRYTHGPVSNPHATWDGRCDSCHDPASKERTELLAVHDRWHAFRCETCHSSPLVFPGQNPKDYAPHSSKIALSDPIRTDCGACHHDHQGRTNSLVQMADSACTQCHRNTSARAGHGTLTLEQKITGFAADAASPHPEFRAVRPESEYPRNLKFHHGNHMSLGLVFAENGKAAFRIGDIANKELRKQYVRYEQAGGVIQLTCAACHELDRSPEAGKAAPGGAALPPRAGGAYMLPISFERHCQACHGLELSTDQVLGGALTDKLRKGADSKIQVPHRLSPERTREFLRDEIIGKLADVSLDPNFKNSPDRLDPDRLKPIQSMVKIIESCAARAERRLHSGGFEGQGFGGAYCGKCHTYTKQESAALTIEPTRSAELWFPNAKFNHASHRAMRCEDCHAGKEGRPMTLAQLNAQEPLGLPGVDNCRQCHGPRRNDPKIAGGVRHGCVDCHGYHNGEHPLHGPGSPLRAPSPENTLTSDALLRGGR